MKTLGKERRKKERSYDTSWSESVKLLLNQRKNRHSRKSFGWPFLFAGVHYPVSYCTCYLDGQPCIHEPDPKEPSKNYSCHKCGNVFTRKNNLYNHLKFQCGQLPRFNCPYCSYRTRHSSNVRSHIRRMHPDQVVYVLDVRCNQQNRELR